MTIQITDTIKLGKKEKLIIGRTNGVVDYIEMTYVGWLDTQSIYLSKVREIDRCIEMLQKAKELLK